MAQPRTTALQRLQKELKTRTNLSPELNEFRNAVRTIVPLCKTFDDIEFFIERRIELGLITDVDVLRCAENIQRLCFLADAEIHGINLNEKEKPRTSNHDALLARSIKERNAIVPTGYQVKLSAAGRMSAAFDRIVGIDFAQRSG